MHEFIVLFLECEKHDTLETQAEHARRVLPPLRKYASTRMWADAQRDGRPDKYRWRPLRNFRNSIPCSTPQSLAEAGCWSSRAVTLPIWERTQDSDAK